MSQGVIASNEKPTPEGVASTPPARHVSGERRRDLDVLRVLIVFGLIFFHTLRVFDPLPWDEGIKNLPPSNWVVLLVGFFSAWGMPMMFVISGFGVWYSLSKRTPGRFLAERASRLLVPLVFGMLVIVPPQMYFHIKQADPAAALPYGQFLLKFFNVRLCDDPFYGLCSAGELDWYRTGHLWFLQYLLILTVLLLPLFLLLRWRGGGRLGPVGARLTAFLSRPAGIFLLALPVLLVETIFGSSLSGGWDRGSYALFLFYGYLIAADRGVSQALGRAWRPMLIIALVAMVGHLSLGAALGFAGVDINQSYDLGSILWRAIKSVNGWAWIVVILGFAARPRKVSPPTAERPAATADSGRTHPWVERALAYAGEAFLPFYILHQTVIIVIGYYVVQWPIAAILKYFAISLSSLGASLLLYEVAVRRTRVTRWLFGMKVRSSA